MTDPRTVPIRRWPVTLTVLMGTIAVVLNATVVNVAIPPIMADFGMSQNLAQWLSTGFLAAMTATMLASARVMERLGQRRTFELCLWVFLAACVLAALSPNAWVMIGARILQGATAGIIQPLALVMIFQVFEDHERGKALGLYGMGVVLAPAVGPVVGGVLIDWLSWRAVYLPAIPFCLLGLWGARRYLPNPQTMSRVAFDWLGLGLLVASLTLVLTGLTALSSDAPRGDALLGVGLLVAAAFVVRLLRTRKPLIDLAVFAYPRFVLAGAISMIYGAGLYGSTYLIPLLAQSVQQLSPSATGLVMMPAGLTLLVIFPLAGRLADRFPAHWLNIVGCSGCAVGLFALAATGPATAFWLLAAIIAFGRMALGLMMPALNIGGLRGLPNTLTHQGSSVISFARQLGGTLGVNLFALLLEIRAATHLGGGQVDFHSLYSNAVPDARVMAGMTAAFRDTFNVFGGLFLVGLALSVAMAVLYYRERHRLRAASA